MKQLILFFVPLLLMAFSCTEKPVNGERGENVDPVGTASYSNSIPCCYERLNGLKPSGNGFGIEPHTQDQGKVDRYVLMIDYGLNRLSEKEEKDFRETTGERRGSFLDSDAFPGGTILCNWLNSITVTSSADYNDIPAGASLASKIMLFTWSVWPSIKAGKDVGATKREDDLYNKYFYFNPMPDGRCYSPVIKKLSDLSEEDLYLIGADSNPTLFMFTELPAVKEHVFTVTYTEGDKKWSVDIPAKFAE